MNIQRRHLLLLTLFVPFGSTYFNLFPSSTKYRDGDKTIATFGTATGLRASSKIHCTKYLVRHEANYSNFKRFGQLGGSTRVTDIKSNHTFNVHYCGKDFGLKRAKDFLINDEPLYDDISFIKIFLK